MPNDTTLQTKERRSYTRVRFNTAATLVQGSHEFHAMVLDLSLKGVLLETPEKYVVDTAQAAYLSIFLSPESEIQMSVRLARSNDTYLGFRCESIDIDSITKLRRLIELNTELPNASERIFEELLAASN